MNNIIFIICINVYIYKNVIISQKNECFRYQKKAKTTAAGLEPAQAEPM